MILFIFWTLFLSKPAKAQWLCQTTSSYAQNSTFYACGHATESSLMKAREEAFKAAKREFEAFCKESENCKDNAYTLKPLRTDCSKEESLWGCYRGIEYNILPYKRSSISIDSSDFQKLITEKTLELQRLKRDAQKAHQINNLNEEIARLKKIEKAETDVENLKAHYKENVKSSLQNAIQISIKGQTVPFSEGSKMLAGIGFGYERIINSRFTFNTTLTHLFGGGTPETIHRGPPLSRSKIQYHSYQGLDLNVALAMKLHRLKLVPNLGITQVNYQSLQYEFNEYGVGLNKLENDLSFTSPYVGVDLRLGKEGHIQLGPRYYLTPKKIGATLLLGINVNF